MTFPFDIRINLEQSIIGASNPTIKIYSGLTTFLGPNGSGKTQLLRGLKNSLSNYGNGKKIRYISAGRLGPMESHRSNYDGQRGTPSFDNIDFGYKSMLGNRHAAETVIGDFATLSERPDILIKVKERLLKLFKRNIIIDWDAGKLKVFFSRTNEDYDKPYSSGREASGLLNLVAILSVLYDDEVGCLIIDEPEVSLHPQLQSFILNEILKVAGPNTEKGKKLVFISTHSTEFIRVNSVLQLASIIFCKDILEPPIQIDPSRGEFDSKKLRALLSRIGQEHKLAFFCHSPLLVEGPSDSIICSALNQKLSLNLEAAGSQILPVIGKDQFPTVVLLFRLIGKKPVILADADAITDNLNIISSFTTLEEANKLAIDKGSRNAPEFAKSIYDDFCQLVNSNWNDIKDIAETHYYWIKQDKSNDEIIAKKRSAFCSLYTTDNSIIQNLDNGEKWIDIKTRLSLLLNFLEKLGCFILRKGTIEAYYQYFSNLATNEKPSEASNEANELIDEDINNVRESYSDIIRALFYCSQIKEINETEAIRDLLLAIVAPALASINKDTKNSELEFLSQSILRTNSTLFKISKIIKDDDIYLQIELNTNILEVNGFPMIIKKDSNPITAVNEYLKLK